MTTDLGGGDFGHVSNVDPGGGLSYRVYTADNQDSYSVSISAPFFDDTIDNYYVFALASQSWNNADTIAAGMPGTFEAGAGNDQLANNLPTGNTYGFPQPLRFFGGAGDDTINPPSLVQDPDDQIATEGYGGSGDDQLYGGNTNDTLYGDTADSFTGNPVIAGVSLAPYDTSNDGDDSLSGYDGNDSLSGDGGDDQLFGGNGSDTLDGGEGNDFLYGGKRGSGNLDILTGGGGADVFMLSYSMDGSNDGAAFWGAFFEKMSQDIANNVAKVAIQDAIKAAVDGIAGGILASALGPIGGDLAGLFVSLIESLASGAKPQAPQDVMVVTDFDPREDVLMLPLQSSIIQSLTQTVVDASQVPGGGGTGDVLQFSAGGDVYAYVELSTGFRTEMGLAPSGNDTRQVLLNLFNFSSAVDIQNGQAGFTNLVSSSITSRLPDGGFQPVAATLPSNAAVALFGAIGGTVISNGQSNTYGAVLAGTNYADALTTNAALADPSAITSLSSTAAYIQGFGGADLIYGTGAADTLSGGDGDDDLYSFYSTDNSGGGIDAESLSGGAGNDTLYGGGTAGTFDGGADSDTFAVIYLTGNPAMQLEVDLVAGYAAERPAPADTAAPAGDDPPFPGTGPDTVRNTYVLAGIENAIGGPLNDWIRGASGSVIEGGAGTDYLDANAGNVSISYASSAAGVTVQLYADSSKATGGDAAGDVIGYGDTNDILTLIGSAQDDVLGGYSNQPLTGSGAGFQFTGDGGSDTFQLLGVNGTGIFIITDFTSDATEKDLIDLRPLGITSFSAVQQFDPIAYTITDPDGGDVFALFNLPGYDTPLTAADFLFASAATGAMQGRRGGDGLAGSSGSDSLTGRDGQDFLFGRGDADALTGRGGEDVLAGGDGDDALFGGAGADRLDGGSGNDTARGGEGNDRVTGEDGADSLFGGAGTDTLLGGNGMDSLAGGEGDDVLDGGAAADRLRGGAGADSFVLRFGELDGDGVDDFARLEGDRLVLIGSGPLTVTALGRGAFTITDGVTAETITVRNAMETDFIL